MDLRLYNEKDSLDYVNQNILNKDNIYKNYETALQNNVRPNYNLQKCRLYVCENASEILKDVDFAYASTDVVKDILFQDGLCVVSEMEVLSAALNWSKVQRWKRERSKSSLSLRMFLKPLLPHIRILTLTLEELLQVQEDFDIFSEAELSMIIKHMSSEKIEVNMSLDFCTLTRKRNQFPSKDNKYQTRLHNDASTSYHQCKLSLQKNTTKNNCSKPDMMQSPKQQYQPLGRYSKAKDGFHSTSSQSMPIKSPIPKEKYLLQTKMLESQKNVTSSQCSMSNQDLNLPNSRTNSHQISLLSPNLPPSHRMFNFPLQNLTTENVLFSTKNFIKCVVIIKMVSGCIAIRGMKLQLKKPKTQDEIEILWSLKGDNGKYEGTCTKELENDTILVSFDNQLQLFQNQECELEVMVDNVKLNQCGVLQSREMTFAVRDLNLEAQIILNSNHDASNEGFFFVLKELQYLLY